MNGGQQAQIRTTQDIMQMLAHWRVPAEDQIKLLGLPDSTKGRALKRLGDTEALPESEETQKRIEHLLGIAEALHTSFPASDRARVRWMHNTNRHFTKVPPLQVMVEDGISGLIRVRSHLDCTYAWDLTGSQG